MKPDQLKRAKEIEIRLLVLKKTREALQTEEPCLAVWDNSGGILFRHITIDGVQHVLPKNIKAICMDAVDTEIAVLQQELDKL